MTAVAEILLPLNPGIWLIVGALIAVLLPQTLSRWFAVILPVFLIAFLFSLNLDNYGTISFFDYSLETFRLDALSRVFGLIFLIASALGNLYALGDDVDKLQRSAALAYAGGAIAAVFAGDMITLFIFFEVAAVASVFLIWARRTERAFAAGMRYLIFQIGAGVILLAGLLIHFSVTGSINFDKLGLDAPGGILILIAFGIKSAFPLVHNWLQDAYPEATISGTVILSGFTTKLAIYALARSYAGTEILIWIGAVMAILPIFYAIIENDLRRVLTYSLNNQLGFMVVGIGIGTEMALNGTISHAFVHILYKALLLMSMGAVLLRTGTCNGSELGGLVKTMPWTAAFCIVGAASASAFPLFSGFISKSMIITAAGEQGYWIIWLILLFASAGVLYHSGIRIPYFAFFSEDKGHRVKEAPWPMLVAMGAAAFLCIIIGVFPVSLYAMLPFSVDYVPYTAYHVINQLQLLMFAALAFTVLKLIKIYPSDTRGINLDTDWVYRKGLMSLIIYSNRYLSTGYRVVCDGAVGIISEVINSAKQLGNNDGILSRTPALGSSIAWISGLLLLVLLLRFA
ncbi:MAG: Na(+)/H(+) antiporter subunit D [Rhodospirillaceae bacterium]|nr:Na(+)/H(+) antiporter subunit D [Rhodospirillaceae bacterium]OUU27204.1 MAG: Na(+)/H(+) antiporter subunit D [Candidatus Endolissoclinum sp. TMED37]